MNRSSVPLLFSLKPRYANLVFDGLKKFELRRRLLAPIKGRDVFIYVTSPVGKLRGGFRVGDVRTGTPKEIWDIVSKEAGIEKQEFDAYYAGRNIAYALEVTEIWEYSNPVGLSVLRDTFHNFVVPQSWRYVKPRERQFFLRMERKKVRRGPSMSVQGKPSDCRMVCQADPDSRFGTWSRPTPRRLPHPEPQTIVIHSDATPPSCMARQGD